MSYNTDCREIRVKTQRSGRASELNLIILLERCLRNSSVIKLKRERGVLFALLLEKVYDSDIRKANESIKRECSKFIDLKNVRLELNEHASHSYAWWFPDGPAAKRRRSGWYGRDSDEEDSSGDEEPESPAEELGMDSPDGKMQQRVNQHKQLSLSHSSKQQSPTSQKNEHDISASENDEDKDANEKSMAYNVASPSGACDDYNNSVRNSDVNKVEKELGQYDVKHCIVVQLTDINQREPALLHFGSDKCGGSNRHFYAVNSRTKKILFQFDNSDAVASIIKSGEHMVEGKVVGVQNACAEDLKEFSGGNCKHERCIVVQLSGNKQTEPAFYHFESDEYGGSEIHFYAVNSRTKKMLLQFDNSDAVASIIQFGEHKVNGEVVSVQNTCAEDLKKFAESRLNLLDMNPSQGNEDEESGPTDTNTIVIELPENFLPTTDAIRLHFENEEYGGDDIKYLRLQPEKRRALVTFDNGKEVVDKVLSHPLHMVNGTKVEVRRCSSKDLAD